MNYAVVGASGNTGRRVVEGLLDRGKEVRAITRTAAKLASLEKKGAKICEGSVDDVLFLTEAFSGVRAVYTMLPPDLSVQDVRASQARTGQAIVVALKAAGVTHVVNLSSQGANRPDKTGPIAGLHDQEQRINGLKGINVVHLRAAFFMENLLQNIPTIRSRGIIMGPLRADMPMAMTATRDIGVAATAHLLTLDFRGCVVHDLLSPRDVTMGEATRILGTSIGLSKLMYVQVSYEQAEMGMVQAGLSAGVARSFIEMYKAFNDGLIVMPSRTVENTTPTTLEAFTTVFAREFDGSRPEGKPS